MGSVNILKASAGSGKTYQLAYRYVREVLENPYMYRHILAVTFTNKATEEMKSRILGELNRLAKGEESPYMNDLMRDTGLLAQELRSRAKTALTKILHDYSHFNVVTIDRFFQRIIRSFVKELGFEPAFNLELKTDTLLESATAMLIDRISSDRELRNWISLLVSDRMDRNKKWDIKGEIIELGNEIFKERYKSISFNAAVDANVSQLISVETVKADLVKNRIKSLACESLAAIEGAGLSVSDFSYGTQGFTSYLLKTASGAFEPYGKRVADALESDEKWYSKSSPRREEIKSVIPLLRPKLTEICALYDDNHRMVNSVNLVRENFGGFMLMERLSEMVAEICAEQNIFPISETNSIIGKLIGDNDVPFVYEKTGNAISRFMIDEFQDTSAQQWENFLPLLNNALSQSDGSPILLVGDVKQSIYRWRGGDWRILGHRTLQTFDNVTEVNLDTNYRSAGVVVQFNNNLIESCVRADNDYLNSLLDQFRDQDKISPAEAAPLKNMLAGAYEGHSQKASRSLDEGYVRIIETRKPAPPAVAAIAVTASTLALTSDAASPVFDAVAVTEPTENSTPQKPVVITIIEELQERGYSPGDIAILVRYNREGVAVAKELLDYKAANPDSKYSYDIVTQEALTIGNSPVVNFILSIMHLAVSGSDSIRLAVYNRYLKRSASCDLSGEEEEFLKTLRLVSIEEAFERILIQYGLGNSTANVAYVQALQNQIHNFAATRIADLPLFLRWWAEAGAQQSINVPQNNDAITIISVHKAKGLQYKAVVIPHCSWPLQPQSRSLLWAQSSAAPLDSLGKVPLKWKNAIADSHFANEYMNELILSHIDNINTLYVAVTRAMEELHIVIPEGQDPAKNIGGLVGAAITSSEAAEVAETNYGRVYSFGSPYNKPQTTRSDAKEDILFPVTMPEFKLRFSLGGQRYFEDKESVALSPRNYGIIMHKVFENISDYSQVDSVLEKMLSDGSISPAEHERVKGLISEAFTDPVIKSWFDPSWTEVRNESNIIVPGASGVRRPDRVVAKGTRVLVVDYKFGKIRREQHSGQIREYAELLRKMGYKEVEGYIWYVELNQVDKSL